MNKKTHLICKSHLRSKFLLGSDEKFQIEIAKDHF